MAGELTGAIGTGLTTFVTTGNPWLGLLSGGLSFFSSTQAGKAQDDYNAQLAALAAADKDRQKLAAQYTKEANEYQHQRDVANAESFRKATVFKETLMQAGIAGFSSQTGLSGSSIEKAAQGRITSQAAAARGVSIRGEADANYLFDLAQKRIDVLAGIVTDEEIQQQLVDLGLADAPQVSEAGTSVVSTVIPAAPEGTTTVLDLAFGGQTSDMTVNTVLDTGYVVDPVVTDKTETGGDSSKNTDGIVAVDISSSFLNRQWDF